MAGFDSLDFFTRFSKGGRVSDPGHKFFVRGFEVTEFRVQDGQPGVVEWVPEVPFRVGVHVDEGGLVVVQFLVDSDASKSERLVVGV